MVDVMMMTLRKSPFAFAVFKTLLVIIMMIVIAMVMINVHLIQLTTTKRPGGKNTSGRKLFFYFLTKFPILTHMMEGRR